MANIPVNSSAVILSGSASITGSFAGFTVAQAVTFTGLKDYFGTTLATSTNTLTFGTGTTVPLYITSASISAGAILLYP
jgi:hypothetical protein